MTSYEHFMLGVTGTLATGLHRRYGWPIAAVAGVAAVLPDWDALSLAFGAAAFDRAHRAWGHNLLMAATLGAMAAAWEYRFGWMARTIQRTAAKFNLRQPEGSRESPTPRTFSGWTVWIVVGAAAGLSHLAADMLSSGHATLLVWGIQLLWPFSSKTWAYPMVPWGDPTVSILFAAGMFAMLRWPERLQRISGITLVAVAAYIFFRGWAFPQL